MLLNLISFLLLFSSSIQCAPISNTTQTIYDVIIVGAGLTGLTAARTIQQNRPDLTVLVIEGRGQVGGRVRYSTMQTRNGVEFIDIGSQFISPNDNLLLEILNEIQIDVKQQLTCGKNSLFEERKKRNIKNVTESNWIKNNFDELLISDELKSLTNISISQFAEGLEISEADSINRLMQTFFDAPAEQVSSAQLALTCNSQNATTVEILRRFGHGQSLIANGGMNEVVRRLADGLLIEYNQKIVSINDTSSPTTLKTSKNRLYSARQVILAVPISTLSNIQLIPQPETPFQQFIENYGPTGHAYYFTMTFQRPTWRLNGKSGKVIYTSQNGPLVWLTTFDTTYASSCSNSTTASSSLWGIAHFSYEVPFETRRRLYIQALIYSFRFADFSPLSVSDVSFANDEFAKSTIPTFRLNIPFDTLKYINNFHTIYQNAHISTSDISTITIGTMNGAINAGKSVGRHVLTILSETNSQTNNLLRDIPLETTTQFVYHTSSHYPPSLFQKSLKDEESSSSLIQRDDPSENQQQQNGTFHYETSSQYPSTLQPTTTTMKHFVFGNLEKSNEKIIEPLPISYDNQEIDPNPSNDNNNNSTTFLYKTSSVMPVTENIETTTFIHFSNGNLFETNQIQRDFINGASVPNQVNTNNFEYSTSTHYPILNNNNLIANRENNVTPSSQIVQELHQVSDNAPNSTSLELATKLTSLVHTILQGLRLN